jgi:tetratricopeptide (TPR) repeat protein
MGIPGSFVKGMPERLPLTRKIGGFIHMKRKVLYMTEKAVYFNRLGLEFAGKGNYADAVAYFDQAIREMPGYAEAWREKANCLDAMGRCEDAVSCYDRAIQIDPGDAEAWFEKGLALKKLGNDEDAFRHMSRGVDLAIGV